MPEIQRFNVRRPYYINFTSTSGYYCYYTSNSTSMEDIEGALLQLGINYAISSRCNLTAVDIMNENGNTVKRGLIAATESVVINILNTTFPRTRLENGSERILLRGSTGRRSLCSTAEPTQSL